MNMSLRNITLASALVVAGAAFAQDAVVPTVTKVWAMENVKDLYTGTFGKNDMRFGTGINGKVYAVDKAGQKILVMDGTTVEVKDAPAGVGTGITTDQAGNLLINRGFPGASSSTNFWIVPADGSEAKELTLTMPEGCAANRVDQIGRVLGDLLSEEGAAFYLTPNTSTVVPTIFVSNGAQADLLDFMTTESSPVTLNTSTIAQPYCETMSEFLDMGDDAVNAFYIRNRSANPIRYFDYAQGEWTGLTNPVGASTQEGFDCFYLGETLYQVMPAKNSQNYESTFVIADAAGNVIYKSDYALVGDASQSFGSFAAHKVSDTKVELYQWFVSGAGAIAAMYTIELPGEDPFVAPDLNLRGEFNEWGTLPMTRAEELSSNGEYVYTVALDKLEGQFKVGDAEWNVDFGGQEGNFTFNLEQATSPEGHTLEAWYKSSNNFVVPALENVKISFYLNPAYDQASWLKVEGTEPQPIVPEVDDRAALAYGLKLNDADNKCVISFNASARANSADVVLTNVDDANEVVTFALGAVKKGENVFDITDKVAGLEANKKYNWAIDLYSQNVAGEEPVVVFSDPDQQTQVVRGGVVCITDPKEAAYGMTVVAHGKGGGFDVYNPDGSFVGKFFQGYSKFNPSNESSPFRGAARYGKAVFADWSDSGAGYWEFDPMNPNDEPVQLLQGEKASNGLYTYNGVAVGGGTSCVGFQGTGDDQKMYGFEEDLVPNHVVRWNIGTSPFITMAPQDLGLSSTLANTNVDIVPVEDGFFASQVRDVGNNSEAVPAFAYFDNDANKLFTSAEINEELGANYTMTNGNSAIAISADRSLFAAGEKDQIGIYAVEWNDNIPTFSMLYVVPFVAAWSHMDFDAANNLHVYGRENGGYNVISLPGEGMAETPSFEVISTKTGVADVAVEAQEGEAVYYNVNGVKVNGSNLATGVYVKVQGKKATKVVVK